VIYATGSGPVSRPPAPYPARRLGIRERLFGIKFIRPVPALTVNWIINFKAKPPRVEQDPMADWRGGGSSHRREQARRTKEFVIGTTIKITYDENNKRVETTVDGINK
jgi:hypothetical protein